MKSKKFAILVSLLWFIGYFSAPSESQAIVNKFNAANTSNIRDENFGFARFIKMPNKYLDVKPFKVVLGQKYKACLVDCAADRKCVSLNSGNNPNSSGLQLCELLDTNILNNSQLLKNKDNFLHFILKTACFPNPCKNQGVCIPNYTISDYTCNCRRGFDGRNCEKEYHSLGMEDGRIPDSQITASSHYSIYLLPKYGRLNSDLEGGSWTAKRLGIGEYLEVDIGTNTTICKIATQGRQNTKQWVTAYSIHYSSDQSTWTTYSANENGVEKVFQANNDENTVVCNILRPPFSARYVRVVVKSWREHISMRIELYSCD
ncbi:lactadherin [Exaiptasia diaphana]|uniref:EGF-like repeat and discoidin I-like domain-containing protein 3 n=1 Tax=Exaiptasia diaphana TaxID=2652724 RepID=A0A913YNT5_EXADI|nr:lactadherin [Exaiptasia diaphana]